MRCCRRQIRTIHCMLLLLLLLLLGRLFTTRVEDWPPTPNCSTTQNTTEIADTLGTIVASSACTGLMHESFQANSFGAYTRPWFAWANSLFGQLILQLAEQHPSLIFKA